MPISIATRIAMMMVRVLRALSTTFSRNACTPLLTASTPVMAVQPLANARTRIQALKASDARAMCGGGATGCGWPPPAIALTIPHTRVTPMTPTKSHVGARNTAPASRTPRRFTIVRTARIPRQMPSV